MGKHGAQRKHFSSVRTRPYTTVTHTYLCTDPHAAGESERAWQGVGRLFHFKLLWQQFQAMLEDVPQGTRYHIPFASPF